MKKRVKRKGRIMKAFSLLITSFILCLLIFSGPAEAFSLAIEISDPYVNPDDVLDFTIALDINIGERLPVDYLKLEIKGPDSISCRFNLDGSAISGCSHLSITPVSTPDFTTGDLTGEYDETGREYDWGYGQGHEGAGMLEYDVKLDTYGLDEGTYRTEFKARIGKNNFRTFSKKGDDIMITDTSALELNVTSPVDGVYSDKKFQFDVTTNKKVEKIEYKNLKDKNPKWYRLCRNCDSYDRRKTLKDGENNITIRATDYFGAVKEENINVIVDSEKPKISRTGPKKKFITNGDDFYIKYTEYNLEKIELFWNPGIELVDCPSGRNQFCTVSVNLSAYDGQWIEYWFEVSDQISTRESKKVKVKVDTTDPVINNPDSFYEKEGKYIYFNMDITEKNLDEVILSYRYRGKQKEKLVCNGLRRGKCVKKVRIRDDYEDMKVIVLDEAGNSVEVGFDGPVIIDECNVNSDCGVDGFIGGPSCTGYNIYQDYQQFECINPGADDSTCTSSINPQFNSTCASGSVGA